MTTNIQPKFQRDQFLGVNVPEVSEEKDNSGYLKKKKERETFQYSLEKEKQARCPGD